MSYRSLTVLLFVAGTAAIAHADKAAAVTLALADDLVQPATVTIDIPPGRPQDHPLIVTSAVARRIEVHALGAGEHVAVNGRRMWSDEIHVGEPMKLVVDGDPGTKVTIVVVQHGRTVATEHDIYGAPASDAKIADRALSLFSFIKPRDGVTRDNAELAERLFTTIDPAFVLYATAEGGCRLVPGEPLLLIANYALMHANGEVGECRGSHPKDYLTTERPAKVAMPAIKEPRSDEDRQIWLDEDFLAGGGNDHEIATYKVTKERASTCYQREWAKRDPEGKADRYDLVTYQHGKVAKIEGYGDKIFEQVYTTCGLAAIEKQRDAIYARLAKTFKADEQRRLDAIAARLAAQ